jgi:hypothetical protein
MLLVVVVGGCGVVLALLIGDFAERTRRRVYEMRGQEVPESRFQRYVAFGFAVFFVAWSVVAYL